MTELGEPRANDFNGKIIAEFRANGGKAGGPFQGGGRAPAAPYRGTRRRGPGQPADVRVGWQLRQPAERDVIWGKQQERNPGFADYEVKAAPRQIPVVVLDPVK